MSEDDRIAKLIEELKDLRLQETSLIRQIEEANRRRQGARVDHSSRVNERNYRAGDRVYITSRIRRPVFAPTTWTGYNERRATVTKVDGERVFFTTDNGTKTWRASKNIRLLLL